MKLTREQADALKLYRGFRESEPHRFERVTIEIPSALMVMGTCEEIHYVTTHGRKAVAYYHEFAPGSRPKLCAGPEEGQIFLVGGRFRVTERGIVDVDAHGREIDDGGHRKRR